LDTGIALFHRREHYAVATIWHAGGVGEGADISSFDRAHRRAAITTLGVAIIARLAALDLAIAASV
jgi:hypothetical protein